MLRPGAAAGAAINHATLKAKGFTDEALQKIEDALATAFDISSCSTVDLGDQFLTGTLKIPAEKLSDLASTC